MPVGVLVAVAVQVAVEVTGLGVIVLRVGLPVAVTVAVPTAGVADLSRPDIDVELAVASTDPQSVALGVGEAAPRESAVQNTSGVGGSPIDPTVDVSNTLRFTASVLPKPEVIGIVIPRTTDNNMATAAKTLLNRERMLPLS